MQSERGVPACALREAVLESGESLSAIARRAEFIRRTRPSWRTIDGELRHGDWVERPDTARLKVALGMKRGTGRNRTTDPNRKHLTYELALRIAEAANIDPVDVGL